MPSDTPSSKTEAKLKFWDQKDCIAPETQLSFLPFFTKEANALQLLNIKTVREFLLLDLSKVYSLKGFGDTTYNDLKNSREAIKEILSAGGNYIPAPTVTESPALNAPITFDNLFRTRELNALKSLKVKTIADFLQCDLNRALELRSVGELTFQSLVKKQRALREKHWQEKTPPPADLVYSLGLSKEQENLLRTLHISKVDEFKHANLEFLRGNARFQQNIVQSLLKLRKTITGDLSPNEFQQNDSWLNSYLQDVPLNDLRMPESAKTFLKDNHIETLQSFLFFKITCDHELTVRELSILVNIQTEHRCQYTPNQFFSNFPSFSSEQIHERIDRCSQIVRQALLGKNLASSDFFALSFENISDLVDGNYLATLELLTAQYELIAEFIGVKNASSNDPVLFAWRQKATNKNVNKLPLFSGYKNCGFSIESFHESFFPLMKISEIQVLSNKRVEYLRDAGIELFGDLLLFPCDHLGFIRSFTEISINKLKEEVYKILIPVESSADTSSPENLIRSLLRQSNTDDRNAEILLSRLSGKTLHSVANDFGLTRERVRQIERKVIKKLSAFSIKRKYVHLEQVFIDMMGRMGGFSHVSSIKSYLCNYFKWNEKECHTVFVDFFLQYFSGDYFCAGNHYYQIKNYLCVKCELVVPSIVKFVCQNTLASTLPLIHNHLTNTTCRTCVQKESRVNGDFIEWVTSTIENVVELRNQGLIRTDQDRYSIQKAIRQIIFSSDNPLTYKEIYRRLCSTDFFSSITEKQVRNAAMNLTEHTKDIFLWDRGSIFTHRRIVPRDKPVLKMIEMQLKHALNDTDVPYYALYPIYEEYREMCEHENIPSAHALFTCLKVRSIPNLYFLRTPYVSRHPDNQQRQNTHLLDAWIAEKKDLVDSVEIKRYAKKLGLDSFRYSTNFAYLDSVIRVGDSVYVHNDTLGWDQQKSEHLLLIARSFYNEKAASGEMFARTDDLLDEKEDDLPVLENNMAWMPSLIHSLLSRMSKNDEKQIRMYGNTDLAYGCSGCGSEEPPTFYDILKKILMKEFSGAAALEEFEAYLRDELQLIRRGITSKMLRSGHGIVLTKYEIFLSETDDAS